MRIFENLNIDFLAKRRIFYFVSLGFFLLGVIGVAFRGLELGIDFLGGSEIVLQFDEAVEISDVRDKVSDIGLGNIEVKTFGGETGVLIRTELQEVPADIYPRVQEDIEQIMQETNPEVSFTISDSTASSITYNFTTAELSDQMSDALFLQGYQASEVSEEPDNTEMIVRIGIADWIKGNLHDRMEGNDFEVLREDRVGPKVGDELKQDAIIAVLLSLVVILIYLGFRFKFIFATGAVAALFHDVFITLGLFGILYGMPGLNLEIDLTVVAAFLTLVGYSINDTVIVFDRVRENLKLHKTENLQSLMNRSINQTMSRTILTGGTTLLTILVLFTFGGEVLRAFAFTLFFGIIIGTYSSIFVASSLVLEYAQKTGKKVEF